MNASFLRHTIAALVLGAALAPLAARANPSETSTLSAVPIAVSAESATALLSAGASLSVVAVEASAEGVVWVLERASDGARTSVRLGTQAAGPAALVAGSAVLITAFSAGWVLSNAGRAVAYVPNRVGAALLHDERVTR